MKKRFAALAVLLLGPAAHAQSAAQTETWGKPADPVRVIGSVYYVGSAGLSSWLIATPQGHILIDGGMDHTAPIIEANIRTLGFKLADVKILLNSHAHLDHAGGLAKLKADTRAALYASAGDKPLLEQGVYPGAKDHSTDFPPVRVDKVIGEGQTVGIGATTLTAHITAGHTPGCTSWTMRVVESGVPHNVIFFCSGTVAANRLVGDPSYPGIADDYRRTFAEAGKINADVFLAPHPEQFDFARKKQALLAARAAGRADNPFVNPCEYSRTLATLKADFERQLAAQTAALEKK